MDATPPGHESDALLAQFLGAREPVEVESLLRRLVEDEAAPVIARVLRGKARASDAGTDQVDELTSAAREELITRLLGARTDGGATEIRNFRSYVAALAYNVWAQHLRVENPGRAMLLNRVRYLLENRTNQRGFALWDGSAGERLCGLQTMRSMTDLGIATPKLQLLSVDPMTVAREAFGGRDWQRMNLADLLASLFRWLERPVELRVLIDVLVELLGVSDEKVSMDAPAAEMDAPEFIDRGASAADSLKWSEYLGWLWRELGHLSLRQRTAFLLHSDVIREFDFRGIASLRQIAATLDFPAEQFAAIWPDLPQDDATIAQRLQLQRQQVINLRRVARDRLGAAWKEWIKS